MNEPDSMEMDRSGVPVVTSWGAKRGRKQNRKKENKKGQDGQYTCYIVRVRRGHAATVGVLAASPTQPVCVLLA